MNSQEAARVGDDGAEEKAEVEKETPEVTDALEDQAVLAARAWPPTLLLRSCSWTFSAATTRACGSG